MSNKQEQGFHSTGGMGSPTSIPNVYVGAPTHLRLAHKFVLWTIRHTQVPHQHQPVTGARPTPICLRAACFPLSGMTTSS
jgi:hypothetical protein